MKTSSSVADDLLLLFGFVKVYFMPVCHIVAFATGSPVITRKISARFTGQELLGQELLAKQLEHEKHNLRVALQATGQEEKSTNLSNFKGFMTLNFFKIFGFRLPFCCYVNSFSVGESFINKLQPRNKRASS